MPSETDRFRTLIVCAYVQLTQVSVFTYFTDINGVNLITELSQNLFHRKLTELFSSQTADFLTEI